MLNRTDVVIRPISSSTCPQSITILWPCRTTYVIQNRAEWSTWGIHPCIYGWRPRLQGVITRRLIYPSNCEVRAKNTLSTLRLITQSLPLSNVSVTWKLTKKMPYSICKVISQDIVISQPEQAGKDEYRNTSLRGNPVRILNPDRVHDIHNLC